MSDVVHLSAHSTDSLDVDAWLRVETFDGKPLGRPDQARGRLVPAPDGARLELAGAPYFPNFIMPPGAPDCAVTVVAYLDEACTASPSGGRHACWRVSPTETATMLRGWASR